MLFNLNIEANLQNKSNEGKNFTNFINFLLILQTVWKKKDPESATVSSKDFQKC